MGDKVNFGQTLSPTSTLKQVIAWLNNFSQKVQSASGRNLIQNVNASGAALSSIANAQAGQVPYFTGPTSVALGAVGSWTPTLQGSSTAGSPTYTANVGSYEQIGRLVIARFTIIVATLGGPAGNMQIGGLPLTSANVPNDNGSGFISDMVGVTLDAGYTSLTCVMPPNTNVAPLFEIGSGVIGQPIGVGRFGAGASAVIGALFYHV